MARASRRESGGSPAPGREGRRICLEIAGISIEVSAEDPGMSLRVQGAAEKFLTRTARPDVRIRAGWSDRFAEPRGEMLFDSGSLWKLYNEDGSLRFRFHSTRFAGAPYKVASFAPDFATGEVQLNRQLLDARLPADPLEYPLDELLVVNLLAQDRGVEVHACGLVTPQGNGYLFLGQSGAGKTTMAHLWLKEPGVTILNDDRIVLRLMGDEVRMYACAFLPFHSRQGLDYSLGMFGEVASRVPCHELGFIPDRSIVGYVLRS